MYKVRDNRKIRNCIKKTKKFGRRSIHDIIKREDLSFGEKIDYIRHAYTYYDGAYEYFFDNGIPNEHRKELNELIVQVISHKIDAGVLNLYNDKIKAWLKERKLEQKIEEQKRNAYLEQEAKRLEEQLLEKEKARLEEEKAKAIEMLEAKKKEQEELEEKMKTTPKWILNMKPEEGVKKMYVGYILKLLEYLKELGEEYTVEELNERGYKHFKERAIYWISGLTKEELRKYNITFTIDTIKILPIFQRMMANDVNLSKEDISQDVVDRVNEMIGVNDNGENIVALEN